jgi:hypothetical protein
MHSFTARSLAPIRTLKKARPHDGARDDVLLVEVNSCRAHTEGLLHPYGHNFVFCAELGYRRLLRR